MFHMVHMLQEASEGRRIAEAALQQASANASTAAERLYARLGEEHRQEVEKVSFLGLKLNTKIKL